MAKLTRKEFAIVEIDNAGDFCNINNKGGFFFFEKDFLLKIYIKKIAKQFRRRIQPGGLRGSNLAP